MRNWTKKDNKIKILGSCEWFLKFECGSPVIGYRLLNGWKFFPKNLAYYYKKFNIIKYQLCGPWNDENVNQKNDNKIKVLGGCEWFLKKLQGINLSQAVADSISDTFTQRTSPLTPKDINIWTTNGFTLTIPMNLLNILSTTNGSTPPISIYLLNFYQTPTVILHQFQWLYAAKSNTPDQEQANIKQGNVC